VNRGMDALHCEPTTAKPRPRSAKAAGPGPHSQFYGLLAPSAPVAVSPSCPLGPPVRYETRMPRTPFGVRGIPTCLRVAAISG
jgi:hypothetical protein